MRSLHSRQSVSPSSTSGMIFDPPMPTAPRCWNVSSVCVPHEAHWLPSRK
ncbi:hypothetical protein ACFPRL_31745 [Pseudoclavibacter helvolus]